MIINLTIRRLQFSLMETMMTAIELNLKTNAYAIKFVVSVVVIAFAGKGKVASTLGTLLK